MTISSPAKVKNEFQVLASGVDSLDLALNVNWFNKDFFEYLEKKKQEGIKEQIEQPITFCNNPDYLFKIRVFGAKGYSWLLYNAEYFLKIGDWLIPQSRPSIMVGIRSEALWRLGPKKAIESIYRFIEPYGKIISAKPSRLDLCLDFFFAQKSWTDSLTEYAVTRAAAMQTHIKHGKLTGISIGKGKIMARMYDKPTEIAQQSQKTWMYHIWGIDHIPEELLVLRVEFQLRREMLKELGLNCIWESLPHLENAWAYCSQKWLKFQSNPDKHHTQRETFEWWKSVQNSFLGIQEPEPLIRSQAVRATEKRLLDQAFGLLTGISALKRPYQADTPFEEIKMEDLIVDFLDASINHEKFLEDIKQKTFEKVAKYHRGKEKHRSATKQRIENGFPVELQDKMDQKES